MIIDNGIIVAVEPDHDPQFDVVAPGFIDLQVNGYDDVDVATADAAAWQRLDAALLAQGVTTWCPTLITAPFDVLDARIGAVGALLGAGTADAIGIHLEGPFLGGAVGAHTGVESGPIDLGWIDALPTSIRLMTLAPERPGAIEATARLVDRGVVVSIGHTTATAEETEALIDAGATMFTHVFNASGAIKQRSPGALGVALTDDRLTVGLIADGIHVDPRVQQLVWRAKGNRGVALVTDAVGWRSGRLGDAQVELVDGAPRRADGTLAGTALTMPAALRHSVNEAGVLLEDAVAAATEVPAGVLGLDDRGTIVPGHRADLVALTDQLQVQQTWVAGRRRC